MHVDSSIASELQHVRAIDNHAHPMKFVGRGETDTDYDALSMDGIEDVALPAPFSTGKYFPEAWKALFGYRYSDASRLHLGELEKTKEAVQQQKGDSYPSWVLDRANTEIMLSNRVSMGRGLRPDRFKWVPFVDMFLFPLNNDAIAAQDLDHKLFIRREEMLLRNYLRSAGSSALPPSFDEYLAFVSRMIDGWKAQGAVALKFELAYLRDLHIGNPPKESADHVYTLYARSSQPAPDEYKTLEDYVFHHIAEEAGRLELPVHFHCSVGGGSYFREANADPLALEPVFNDPSLRKTKFVMLHGGWPFASNAAALILKPNVFVDISAFMYLAYPSQAARAVRLYVEAAPEKVLYGSDASPFGGDVGWEETAWIGSRNAREELGLALTHMVEDGEITHDRAKEIARMVMRDNARHLYRF